MGIARAQAEQIVCAVGRALERPRHTVTNHPACVHVHARVASLRCARIRVVHAWCQLRVQEGTVAVYRHASSELQADADVALEALRQQPTPYVLHFVPVRMRARTYAWPDTRHHSMRACAHACMRALARVPVRI